VLTSLESHVRLNLGRQVPAEARPRTRGVGTTFFSGIHLVPVATTPIWIQPRLSFDARQRCPSLTFKYMSCYPSQWQYKEQYRIYGCFALRHLTYIQVLNRDEIRPLPCNDVAD